MQISLQGAWAVIPAHLNELSPPEIRGTFPGFVYQLGNLLAAINLNLQVWIAEAHANNYGLALAIVVGVVVVVIILLAAFGPEQRGVPMGTVPVRATLATSPAAGIEVARTWRRAER
jgi:SHS family lactate transporter-like MFS transporter